jgi:hypothetical protein
MLTWQQSVLRTYRSKDSNIVITVYWRTTRTTTKATTAMIMMIMMMMMSEVA